MGRQTVELIVAEGCNLACDYCFEHHKTKRCMSFDTASAIVEEYLTSDDEFEEVMIDFMGGEPMIAFDLIRQIVEYVTSREWPKPYGFSMSTNGTLFDEDKKRWFIKHRSIFTPMLSFDGTRIAQDMNRSRSYKRVMENIEFFRKNWPAQSIKMTVNDRSLPYLADGILSIIAMGHQVEANLVHEDVWGKGKTRERNLTIMEYELARLVDFYTEFPTLKLPMMLSLPIVNTLTPKATQTQIIWCGAGDGMVAISKDGKRYPCHRFMDFSAGRGMSLQDYDDPACNVKSTSECDSCPMIAACPSCQAHNWEYNGSITDRVVHHCRFVKLQMVATAATAVNRINTAVDPGCGRVPKMENEDLNDLALRLEAARKTFASFSDIPRAELKPYVTGTWPGGAGWEDRVRWRDRRDYGPSLIGSGSGGSGSTLDT